MAKKSSSKHSQSEETDEEQLALLKEGLEKARASLTIINKRVESLYRNIEILSEAVS